MFAIITAVFLLSLIIPSTLVVRFIAIASQRKSRAKVDHETLFFKLLEENCEPTDALKVVTLLALGNKK